jgi:hypothetical protein
MGKTATVFWSRSDWVSNSTSCLKMRVPLVVLAVSSAPTFIASFQREPQAILSNVFLDCSPKIGLNTALEPLEACAIHGG